MNSIGIKGNNVHLNIFKELVGSAHPTFYSFFIMLSAAKHLALRDSSDYSGSLKMTKEIPLVVFE